MRKFGKKTRILFSIFTLAAFAGISVPGHAQPRKTQVRAQLERLLQEHHAFLQTAYGQNRQNGQLQNASFGGFERGFFMNVAFVQDAQIQNFLRNVEYDIQRSGKTGYTMMSYTSYVMTGGKTHGVQYTYQSNGTDVTLVKSTNSNGKMLRSVYYYDIQEGTLKADDFMENRKIHEKVYKI